MLQPQQYSRKYNAALSKRNMAIAMFIIVNFLFSVKYLSRISDYYILLSVVISALYLFAIPLIQRIVARYNSRLHWVNILLLIMFLGLSSLVFEMVDVNSINVDRWSVISTFWDEVFKGNYAYYAKSNDGNVPGPMPFYFLLAFPFYIVGELGYFSFAGLAAFYFILRMSLSSKSQTVGLIMVMCSLPYLWEIVCRSNIFLNGTIVLFTIIYVLGIEKFTTARIILAGILIGLVLSTRNVFVIPFIITFVFKIKNGNMKFLQVMAVGSIALFCFALTFLPFVMGHWDDFLVMNPFIIQGSYFMPLHFTLLFLAASAMFGFFCKSAADVHFYSAMTLFLTISFYLLYKTFLSGFEAAFFGIVADISYFILCLPFAVYYYLLVNDSTQDKVAVI